MLAQMPRPFVHRLRDIRIQQIEEERRQTENDNMNNKSPSLNTSAIDELVDELT
jgi:hypothetical protein